MSVRHRPGPGSLTPWRRVVIRRAHVGSLIVNATVGLALMLAGCGKGGPEGAQTSLAPEKQQAVDGWIQQNGAAVSTQVDHLRAIYAKAKAVSSPVTPSKIDAPDLVFHGTSPLKNRQVAGANAEVLSLEKIISPEALAKGELAVLVSPDFIHDPAFVVQHKKFPPSYPSDSMSLEVDIKMLGEVTPKLLGLKYIVLLRQLEYTPAVFSGDMFLSGLYRADALVFRVADETLVGTVSVGVKNRPSVSTKYTLGKGSNAEEVLTADLAGGIRPVTVANVLKAMK